MPFSPQTSVADLHERKGERERHTFGVQVRKNQGKMRNAMKAIGVDMQLGKGNGGYAVGVAPTCAAVSHGNPNAVCFILDSMGSNSMKSANPRSGFHKSEYSVTLDTSSQNPTRNGGGMLIVQKLGGKGGVR